MKQGHDMAEANLSRRDFVRPIILAIALTFLGEMAILLIWGRFLFPAGDFIAKLLWTAVCGLAMGATIGALVTLLVTGRLQGVRVILGTATLYLGVLSLCTLLCYQIDLDLNLFGARQAALLFIAGGMVPAVVSTFLYVWLLYSHKGRRFLARLGV